MSSTTSSTEQQQQQPAMSMTIANATNNNTLANLAKVQATSADASLRSRKGKKGKKKAPVVPYLTPQEEEKAAAAKAAAVVPADVPSEPAKPAWQCSPRKPSTPESLRDIQEKEVIKDVEDRVAQLEAEEAAKKVAADAKVAAVKAAADKLAEERFEKAQKKFDSPKGSVTLGSNPFAGFESDGDDSSEEFDDEPIAECSTSSDDELSSDGEPSSDEEGKTHEEFVERQTAFADRKMESLRGAMKSLKEKRARSRSALSRSSANHKERHKAQIEDMTKRINEIERKCHGLHNLASREFTCDCGNHFEFLTPALLLAKNPVCTDCFKSQKQKHTEGTQICKFFCQGKCKHGPKCKYSHNADDLLRKLTENGWAHPPAADIQRLRDAQEKYGASKSRKASKKCPHPPQSAEAKLWYKEQKRR